MNENKEWLDIPDFLRNQKNLAEEQASASTALLRCPFCGGSTLHQELWHLESGDTEAVECATCGGSAPVHAWNSRPDPWIDGATDPAPGQRVLLYYQGEHGEPVGPLTGTPVHEDDSHLIDGRSIYRPMIRWMPLPEWSA